MTPSLIRWALAGTEPPAPADGHLEEAVLHRLIAGLLAGAEREAALAHIVVCPPCRKRVSAGLNNARRTDPGLVTDFPSLHFLAVGLGGRASWLPTDVASSPRSGEIYTLTAPPSGFRIVITSPRRGAAEFVGRVAGGAWTILTPTLRLRPGGPPTDLENSSQDTLVNASSVLKGVSPGSTIVVVITHQPASDRVDATLRAARNGQPPSPDTLRRQLADGLLEAGHSWAEMPTVQVRG